MWGKWWEIEDRGTGVRDDFQNFQHEWEARLFIKLMITKGKAAENEL